MSTLPELQRQPLLDDDQIAILVTVARDHGSQLLQELLDLFVTENGPRLEELNAHVAIGNFPAAARAAHGIAGSSANIGGARLSLVCKSFEENAAEAKDPAFLEAYVGQIRTDYALTVDAFRKIIAEN